jgi:large subunit ribosomal protein L22
MANASNDLDVNLSRLVVVDARVDGGPLLSGRVRFMPRAQGRAFPIRKRTSHLRVTLAEVGEEK